MARALALVLMVLASVTLGGCGISVLGRRDHASPPPASTKAGSAHKGSAGANHEPVAAPREDEMTVARERMAQQPTEPFWPYRIGALHAASDSLAWAEAALLQSLARDPSYPPALALLSKLYFDSGRYEAAVEKLQAARARSHASAREIPDELLQALAVNAAAMGRPDLARDALSALAKPDSKRASAAGAYVALRDSTARDAGAKAHEAVKDQSKSAANQNNLGISRLEAGDPIEARKAFLEAIEIDPRLPGPYYNLAILEKFFTFDDVAADQWFRRWRERSSDDPDGLARVFHPTGPKDLADEGAPR